LIVSVSHWHRETGAAPSQLWINPERPWEAAPVKR